MPFAVATVALISAEMLSLSSPRPGIAETRHLPRPVQRPDVADLKAMAPDRNASSFRLAAPDGPAGSTDLAVYVGKRDRGAQFEFGALGGGRSDAPGLIHVGIGWDF